MSFHNDMFHETKRERKYYEDKKQKALRYIDHTLKLDITQKDYYLKVSAKLYEIRKLVNDI